MIVQTRPVFIKSKDCESSTDDLNEYFRVAVSGLTVKQEFKCRDCSENFRIKRHLMTHRRATHKEKVKICSKFATRNHCIFGSERCWYIHKESGTNNSLSETESECKLCEKVFRALPDLMWHNKQEHNENIASCYKEASGNCMFGPNSCWFSHIKSVSNNRQKEKRFKCRTCEQIFNLKPVLMKHRKQEHNEKVESCYKAASGTCSFAKESCWFTH